ncbi:hypothetical protein ADUPG1_006762, partial [Aduncisulcus paluster]
AETAARSDKKRELMEEVEMRKKMAARSVEDRQKDLSKHVSCLPSCLAMVTRTVVQEFYENRPIQYLQATNVFKTSYAMVKEFSELGTSVWGDLEHQALKR